jgi:DNA repair protein RadC
MGIDTLYVRDTTGEFIPADRDAIIGAAKAQLRSRLRRGAALTSPTVVRDFLAVQLGARDCEYFCLVLLDGRHRFLKFVELFRGTIDRSSVHPREVVKVILETEAAACLLVHNHPSQSAEPSAVDELITRRLKEVLGGIEVRVLDHLLVAGGEVISFVERGLL